jgi:hypothetical protein
VTCHQPLPGFNPARSPSEIVPVLPVVTGLRDAPRKALFADIVERPNESGNTLYCLRLPLGHAMPIPSATSLIHAQPFRAC